MWSRKLFSLQKEITMLFTARKFKHILLFKNHNWAFIIKTQFFVLFANFYLKLVSFY